MIPSIDVRQTRPCYDGNEEIDDQMCCVFLLCCGDYPCDKNPERYEEYSDNSYDISIDNYKLSPCKHHITLPEVEELMNMYDNGELNEL